MELGVSAPFLQHLVNDLLRTPKDGTSSAPARVLLIEDDADLAAMACEYLTRDGFDVSCATDGVSATRAAADGNPDLVVLDIGLPDTDGLSVLRKLRQGGSQTVPVIIVTARAAEADRVLGLELGADDYLVKPFSLRELGARVRAVLRRTRRTSAGEVVRLGRLAVDLTGREARVDGARVPLTPLEYGLLEHLATSPGQTFSRDQLLGAVWGSARGWQNPSTVGEHVHRLRRKLTDAGADGAIIVTVRGYGYRIDGRQR